MSPDFQIIQDGSRSLVFETSIILPRRLTGTKSADAVLGGSPVLYTDDRVGRVDDAAWARGRGMGPGGARQARPLARSYP